MKIIRSEAIAILMTISLVLFLGCSTFETYVPPQKAITMSRPQAVSKVRSVIWGWATTRGDWEVKNPYINVTDKLLEWKFISQSGNTFSNTYRKEEFEFSRPYSQISYYIETTSDWDRFMKGYSRYLVRLNSLYCITFEDKAQAFEFMEALYVLGAHPVSVTN